MEGEDKKLADKLSSFLPYLNEGQKRIYLATETDYVGRGGKAKIQKLAGVSHNTINRGLKELAAGAPARPDERIRKEGGGRKKKIAPGVWEKVRSFIEPHRRERGGRIASAVGRQEPSQYRGRT